MYSCLTKYIMETKFLFEFLLLTSFFLIASLQVNKEKLF